MEWTNEDNLKWAQYKNEFARLEVEQERQAYINEMRRDDELERIDATQSKNVICETVVNSPKSVVYKKMIRIGYTDPDIDVNKGLAKNWIRNFKNDNIRVPQGWVHSIEINDRMYSFSSAIIDGAKFRTAKYIIVKQAFTRNEALGNAVRNDNMYFVLPFMTALRPYQEEMQNLNVTEWLKANCLISFTETQLKQWESEKKIKTSFWPTSTLKKTDWGKKVLKKMYN